MLKLILSAALFSGEIFFSGTAKKFPSLTGETLDGKTVTIPADLKGKKSIIGMAYSEKAGDALSTWHQPMFDKFVAKVGMFDSDYDVRLFFVPMYIGLKQVAYDASIKKLRKDNRDDLYPYILFYKGDLEPYGTELKMTDKSLPYFFVLDESGNVVYSTSGSFTEKKMEEIESALE